MAVDAKHPEMDFWEPIWKQMRATEMGEEAVKQEKEVWLPKPNGFNYQLDGGAAMYGAYLARAAFPDILQPTLQGMVGVIHRLEAQITGLEEGKPLAYMWERCTLDDRIPLEVFHRRITAEILLMSRYGVLVDVPSKGEDVGKPYFVGYSTEQIINWSENEMSLFVLDESRRVRGGEGYDEFEWRDEKRFRVLRLTDEEKPRYSMQLFVDNVDVGEEEIFPVARANGEVQEIPFVVVGPRELTTRGIDPPPLKGVSAASLVIYRLDADYKHQLFNSGQETFVIKGGEADATPKVLGSGVVITLSEEGDAKYVSPTCSGIAAHRTAIIDARQEAVAAGVKLFDQGSKAESGEALRLRSAAQTATLTTISQCSAAALEKALRHAAVFVGQDPNEIVVKPNLRFVDTTLDPQKAMSLVEIWQGGAISKQTLYENLQRGEIASAERTFEEEQEIIDKEMIDNPMLGGGAGGQVPGSTPLDGEETDPGSLVTTERFVENGDGLEIE